MWEPPAGWTSMPGHGPASSGIWRVPGSQPRVAKRVARPPEHERVAHRPGSLAYWRREVDALTSGLLSSLVAVAAPEPVDVLEDEEGITLLLPEVVAGPLLPHAVAPALMRCCASGPVDAPWLLEDQFGQRLAALEHRGGWRHLSRTQVADLAALLWDRRAGVSGRLDALPRGFSHGDVTSANVAGHDSRGRVILLDWASCGVGAVGHDLGYWWLSAGGALEELVEAAVSGTRFAPLQAQTGVLLAARATAVFTAFTRADWALGRVAPGEGALAAKMRHPAVARHVRDVARVEGHARALIGLE